MDDVRACYGRMYGRLERCETCEERVWCAEAADPKPLTGPHAGPTGDDAAFEMAEAVECDASEIPESLTEIRRLAAKLVWEILRRADGNEDRMRIYLRRLEGMSLAEIGRRIAERGSLYTWGPDGWTATGAEDRRESQTHWWEGM